MNSGYLSQVLQVIFNSLLIFLYVSDSGKLYGFGANGEGQLGLPEDADRVCVPKCINLPTHSTIKMVAAGAEHSVLLTGK